MAESKIEYMKTNIMDLLARQYDHKLVEIKGIIQGATLVGADCIAALVRDPVGFLPDPLQFIYLSINKDEDELAIQREHRQETYWLPLLKTSSEANVVATIEGSYTSGKGSDGFLDCHKIRLNNLVMDFLPSGNAVHEL